ncbi:MAG TPA: GNAT family N-acyltransferase [Gemmatimonadales bacterium]|jgi:putative hemolysin|nr:GNAT family N-acyltransferase [Gemmatimonadales bacterium]
MSEPAVLSFPATLPGLPPSSISAGRYLVRFARTADELDRILRLRYEVFNLELHEGLDAAHASGRDEDEFDRRFHHLLIEDTPSGEVVGTYRMQTAEMAGAGAGAGGYYSAGLFEVEALPEPVLRSAVEIGRACVARPHRNGRVLHLLWRGLAAYLAWNMKSKLFGCCSLTSQDEALGLAVHQHLLATGAVHPTLRIAPRPEHACGGGVPPATDHRPPTTDSRSPLAVPALFQAYLSLGAKALGPPAVDPEFKTIDWLVLLDVAELDGFTFRSYFR